MAAKKAQRAWNQGMTGAPKAGRVIALRAPCPDERCGSLAPRNGRPPRGMVRVNVKGSDEPCRYYCDGWCAGYGLALADVRSIHPRAAA